MNNKKLQRRELQEHFMFILFQLLLKLLKDGNLVETFFLGCGIPKGHHERLGFGLTHMVFTFQNVVCGAFELINRSIDSSTAVATVSPFILFVFLWRKKTKKRKNLSRKIYSFNSLFMLRLVREIELIDNSLKKILFSLFIFELCKTYR